MKFTRILVIILLVTISSSSKLVAAWSIIFDVSNYAGGYNISCHDGSDGSIYVTVIGTPVPPFSYNWSNGTTSTNKNLWNLEAGVYVLTVTDSVGATFVDSVTLTEPNAYSVNLIPSVYEGGFNISVAGSNTGSIEAQVLGGTPPYYYVWSTSEETESILNLDTGMYFIEVWDVSNCVTYDTIVLTQPPALVITSLTSTHDISCFGGDDGAINLTVGGGVPPYEYLWSNVSTEEDPDSLDVGQYNVLITDANGATKTSQITLTQPNQIDISTTPTIYPNGKNVSCYNCYNGAIVTTVTGGVPPYDFLWTVDNSIDTFATVLSLDTLGKGLYKILVTDANGCTLSNTQDMQEGDRDDWAVDGNIVDTTNAPKFIGTTNQQDLIFKANAEEYLRISSTGDITAAALADVNGLVSKILTVDKDGKFIAEDPYEALGEVAGQCLSFNRTMPWRKTHIVNPDNAYDVMNCYSRFGYGVLAPLDKIHVKGFSRYSSDEGTSNYLRIGRDTDSKISSYGIGELLINHDSPQDVRINTGTTNGDVETGGNTFLATKNGKFQLFSKSNSSVNSFQILRNDQIPFRRGISIDDDPSGKFNFYIHSWMNGASFNFFANDASNGTLKNLMTIGKNGVVEIGSGSPIPSNYIFGVHGKIIAEEVMVKLQPWPDYVFSSDYKLKPLKELNNYIIQNSHLPGIPSASEIEESGIGIGELLSKQMEKIEELTLYVLDLQKQLDDLRSIKK